MSLVVYCADIGSVNQVKVGWARLVVARSPEMCTTGQKPRMAGYGIGAASSTFTMNSPSRTLVKITTPLLKNG